MNAVPSLDALGRDLLVLSRRRVVVSLLAPFVVFAAYIAVASLGWWIVATGCVVVLSFITYGSVSHDLVHRSLGLPARLNDALLSVIELMMLRSGRAYRLAHLNHHAKHPGPDDPEGAASHAGLGAALVSGFLFFPRLWCWAHCHHARHRLRLIVEALLIVFIAAGSLVLAAWGVTVVPLVYVLLAYAGTWIIPLATSYIPHRPDDRGVLFQTRRFRGRLARILALDHLYHLEHHLYPAVPHHHWPELARRLDPHLDAAGVPIVRLAPQGGRNAEA